MTSITRDEYLKHLWASLPIEPPESTGGHVIMGTTTDLATLNPVIRSDVIALYVINFVFSYLAIQSPVDGTMVPDLADYWERSDDGITYTFHINQNANWHDGQPVTAADCVFTFEAVLDEDSLSPIRSDFMQVVNSYRAVDDKTFEMTVSAPMAQALEKTIAAIPIIPQHIWADIPISEWGAAPGSTGTDPSQVVGSGPFRFVEWVGGDHATIERNDDYFVPELLPAIDLFSLRVHKDPQTAIQALITGEVDIAYKISPEQYEGLQASNPEFQFQVFDDWSWTAFIGNADPEIGEFFVEPEARQALMYAVDRELVVDSILNGLGVPAIGIQPPSSPAFSPDQVSTVYTYDPEKSNELLESIGWVDSDGDGIRERDGVKFSVDFVYSADEPVNMQLVPYLQQEWQAIGVEVIPSAIPAPTLAPQIIDGSSQLALIKITWTIDDLGLLYRCDAIPPAGFNLPRVCNEEYDVLNDEALYELDPERRRDLNIQQANIANDDAHWGVLYFGQSIFPASPRIHNFFANGISGMWSTPLLWVSEE